MDRQTDGRTDGRTDGWTDGHGETSIPPATNPYNFVAGGIMIGTDSIGTSRCKLTYNDSHDTQYLILLGLRLGIWYLMPLSTIFQLYRRGQLY